MNVGELRALLEFVDDDTNIYIARYYNSHFSKLFSADARIDFVHTDQSGLKVVADDDELITEEIGLVIW